MASRERLGAYTAFRAARTRGSSIAGSGLWSVRSDEDEADIVEEATRLCVLCVVGVLMFVGGIPLVGGGKR